MRKQKITMTVDAELVKRIDKLAQAVGQSRSAWLEGRIRDGIDDEETGIQALTDPVVGPALLGIFKDRDVLRGMANMFREQMTDGQLQLFAERVSRLAGKKPRGKDSQRRGRR